MLYKQEYYLYADANKSTNRRYIEVVLLGLHEYELAVLSKTDLQRHIV